VSEPQQRTAKGAPALSPSDEFDQRFKYLWMGHHRRLTDEQRAKRIASLKDVWTLMPSTGFIPSYVVHHSPMTDAPPIFHLGAALVAASCLVRRRAWMMEGGTRITPNLWVALLATSTRLRKSTCVHQSLNSLPVDVRKAIALGQSWTVKDFAHTVGVSEKTKAKLDLALDDEERTFVTRPDTLNGVALVPSDELSGLILALNANYNRGAVQMLMQVYDQERWSYGTKTAGCAGLASGTFVNMLAASTLDGLSSVIREQSLNNGFLPRWLPFYAEDQDYTLSQRDDPLHDSGFPEARDELIARTTLGERTLSGVAADEYHAWYRRMVDEASDDMADWTQRLTVYALKIALLYQVTSEKQPQVVANKAVISKDNLLLACRLVERIAKDTTLVLEEQLAFGRADDLVKKLRSTIRKAVRISRRDLSRKWHRHSKSNIDAALKTLKDQGEIKEDTGTKGGDGWRWESEEDRATVNVTPKTEPPKTERKCLICGSTEVISYPPYVCSAHWEDRRHLLKDKDR
jgi:hypothetical protein